MQAICDAGNMGILTPRHPGPCHASRIWRNKIPLFPYKQGLIQAPQRIRVNRYCLLSMSYLCYCYMFSKCSIIRRDPNLERLRVRLSQRQLTALGLYGPLHQCK
jgi:hypothetical protein